MLKLLKPLLPKIGGVLCSGPVAGKQVCMQMRARGANGYSVKKKKNTEYQNWIGLKKIVP